MRFSTVLLTLAAATSFVLTKRIEDQLNKVLYLTDIGASTNADPTTDINNIFSKKFLNKLTKECRDEIEKTNNDCLNSLSSTSTSEDYNNMCKKISTETCLKFFKDPLTIFPKCANDPTFKDEVILIQSINPKENYNCLRDKEGNPCPYTSANINGFNSTSFREAILETCKSKVCTENLITSLDSNIKNIDIFFRLQSEKGDEKLVEFLKGQIIKMYNEVVDYLKDPKCTSQAVDDTATTTYLVAESGANSIKITSALFTTLSLVLAYLL